MGTGPAGILLPTKKKGRRDSDNFRIGTLPAFKKKKKNVKKEFIFEKNENNEERVINLKITVRSDNTGVLIVRLGWNLRWMRSLLQVFDLASALRFLSTSNLLLRVCVRIPVEWSSRKYRPSPLDASMTRRQNVFSTSSSTLDR